MSAVDPDGAAYDDCVEGMREGKLSMTFPVYIDGETGLMVIRDRSAGHSREAQHKSSAKRVQFAIEQMHAAKARARSDGLVVFL